MFDDFLEIETSVPDDPKGSDKISTTVRSEDPEVIESFEFFRELLKKKTNNRKYSKNATWIFILNIATKHVVKKADEINEFDKTLEEASDV
jgi:hypothetical protein